MPPCEGSDVGCNKIPAERGNDMQLDRCFRFPTRSPRGSAFSFILVDLYFARLLHLLAQIVTNSWKSSCSLPCRRESRIWSRLAAKSAWDGDCTSVTAITTPLAPLLIGAANVPGPHAEGNRSLSRHRSDIGTCPSGETNSPRLHRSAQLFGRFFQIMVRLGAVGEFCRLL